MRKKIKLITNKGKTFDWFLNLYLNFILWVNGIDDDVEAATDVVAYEINKWTK